MPLLLDRKDSIETEEFKTGTYLNILVYTVFHNVVIWHLSRWETVFLICYSILLYEEYLANS